MLDITKAFIPVRRLITVIRSANHNHHKKLFAQSRYSDAFVYILSGSCTYRISNTYDFTVKQGDILYLAHNADYTMYINDADYHYIYCDFVFDSSTPRKSNVYKSSIEAEKLFRKLLDCYTASSPESEAEAMSVLYSIYACVLAGANQKTDCLPQKTSIADAKNYIDRHFSDTTLSVRDLAERSNMSEVYFRKLFQVQYACSPSRYISSKRLQYAKHLMQYPFLSLEQCAVKSGFSSLQYFCRVFKKETGMTPATYRKKELSC